MLVLSQLNDSDYAEAQQIAGKFGIEVCPATMFEVDPDAEEPLGIAYQNLTTQRYVRDRYDMVVLCSDVAPTEELPELAQLAEVELDQSGYVSVADADDSGVSTTRPGVLVAGCGSGPKNIKDSLATAHAAASGALANLDQRLLRADYAAEDDAAADTDGPVTDEEKRALIEKMLYALLDR